MAFREREPVRRPPLRPVNRPIEVDIERTAEPQRRSIVQTAAMVFGWLSLIFGICGFLTPFMSGTAGGLFTAGPGLLFGVFATNWVHNVAHIILGLWGISAARSFAASRGFFIGQAIIYGLLVVMGVAMATPGIFHVLGMSHNVADNWLHGILFAVALIMAFTRQDRDRRLA